MKTTFVRHKIIVYAAVLAIALTAAVAGLTINHQSFGNPWVIAGLALVAILSERRRIKFSSSFEQSISLLPAIFAAVLFGPLAAAVVGACSLAADFRSPYLRPIVYTFSRGLVGIITGTIANLESVAIGNQWEQVVVTTCVAAFTAEVLDASFATAVYWLRHGNATAIAKTLAPLVVMAVPLYAPLVALLTFAYREVSGWTLPLFLGPAVAAQQLFVLYQEQRRLTVDLTAANTRLEQANLSFTAALVTTLDARDRYTAGHSAAVAVYARDIAKRMELAADVQELAHQCGLVHDIGKIGLTAGLLEKPGALTLDERRHMEKHSEIGERILRNVEDYAEIATVVRHHHERVDGNGYPDNLSNNRIPLLSRIIAVADAYNAMTSDRPYRDAMPSRVARLRLAQAVESQFDTAVVAAFEAILAGATEDYRCARGPEFEYFPTKSAPSEASVDQTVEAA